jgi:hypothetical protein
MHVSHGHVNVLPDPIHVSHGHVNGLRNLTHVSHGHVNELRDLVHTTPPPAIPGTCYESLSINLPHAPDGSVISRRVPSIVIT